MGRWDYRGPVRKPFDLPGPDGNVYFDLLGSPPALVPLYQALADRIRFFRREAARERARKPPDAAIITYWDGWATRFQAALLQLERDVTEAARQAAVVADQRGRDWIKTTETGRPATSKQRHMEDNLLSRHTPAGALDIGVVGLFDKSVLDKTRAGRTGTTYWGAQEFGTNKHVGRVVRGYFMPGYERPDQSQFRVHPEFKAMGRVYSRMTIDRPIEERGFLRRAVEDAGMRRDVLLVRAEEKVVRVARQYAQSRPPQRRRGVNPRRPRR